jgi:hypothetical protein
MVETARGSAFDVRARLLMQACTVCDPRSTTGEAEEMEHY